MSVSAGYTKHLVLTAPSCTNKNGIESKYTGHGHGVAEIGLLSLKIVFMILNGYVVEWA